MRAACLQWQTAFASGGTSACQALHSCASKQVHYIRPLSPTSDRCTQGRTVVHTRDGTGVEETHETLHGLTESEARTFDADWAARGGGPTASRGITAGHGRSASGVGDEGRGRRNGWLRLPDLHLPHFSGGDGGGGGHGGGGGGHGSAGATSGPRYIDIA